MGAMDNCNHQKCDQESKTLKPYFCHIYFLVFCVIFPNFRKTVIKEKPPFGSFSCHILSDRLQSYQTPSKLYTQYMRKTQRTCGAIIKSTT